MPTRLTVMAGLVPAIHESQSATMRGAWVYIMTNRPNGTLYVGVTNNIARRFREHRDGPVDGFTERYGLKWLVWYEAHPTSTGAIRREKAMKHWPRTWKVRLILATNPDWDDVGDTIVFCGGGVVWRT
ncbi:GIY-YIG nuclease family protein [Bauldia sp.]|uniref:GIY-YIG nuclease family protein n=1 Tax=Bauldia sp. TaxID=2575872 RepID=UPI003BAA2449